MQIVGRLHIGLGPVHRAVDLVVAVGEMGEMGVRGFQLVDQVGLTRKIVAQLVRGVGPGLPFIEVTM